MRDAMPKVIPFPSVPPTSFTPASRFLLGERIHHAKFGAGTIVSIDRNRLLVDFDCHGQRRVIETFVEKAKGWLVAKIEYAEVKRVDSETLLSLGWNFEDVLWIEDAIVLNSGSKERIAIGQRQLSALCHAIGRFAPLTDSYELLGWTCFVEHSGGKALTYRAGPYLNVLLMSDSVGSA